MRSKLFVPASRPELFAKALNSQADALSFDLEDAVAESAKASAREQLAGFLSACPATEKTLIVRVNAQGSEHYMADLMALVPTRAGVINLPKVESAAAIAELAHTLERLEQQAGRAQPLRILANIESPKGLRLAAEIAAAHPRLMGLQLGFADLLEPLGIDRRDTASVRHIQLSVRLAAGEAGLPSFDSSFAAINDPAGFQAEARHARTLGYAGKSCIHPSQIDMANAAFLPGEQEIASAQRVVAAAIDAEKAGIGAYTVDGQMVDGPFVVRAREVLRQAQQAGLLA
ncbi:aldolase/citrate lyase family protein [Pseudomonas sp. NPDC007930]|uniref:HpcH/HpaI aldolase/citrate lyase family protein n=1 Tax=Pseudomonas sp. NPDC007930 TaxID=3364417 RepID=UPI0036E1EC06